VSLSPLLLDELTKDPRLMDAARLAAARLLRDGLPAPVAAALVDAQLWAGDMPQVPGGLAERRTRGGIGRRASAAAA
jgi:hypothetical protein